MNATLIRAHSPVAKPACQGFCSGYGTCSNCPPLIVVATMLALGKERNCRPRME
jgi:hypothetical protein